MSSPAPGVGLAGRQRLVTGHLREWPADRAPRATPRRQCRFARIHRPYARRTTAYLSTGDWSISGNAAASCSGFTFIGGNERRSLPR